MIEWPSAYEGICLALMWCLCSESVNCSDGWPEEANPTRKVRGEHRTFLTPPLFSLKHSLK